MTRRNSGVLVVILVGSCLLLAGGATSAPTRDESFRAKIQEARMYDPLFCKEDSRDRTKAISLYREALALRPGDVRNIEVEHRIAQLYAFYSNPKTGERAMPAEAAEVFGHIVQTYPPNQLSSLRSCIGLGSCAVMAKNPQDALGCYRAALEFDPDKIEAVTEGDAPASPDAREWAKRNAREAHLVAVDALSYVARRISPEEQERQLAEIAEQYKGTDVAMKAGQHLLEALGMLDETRTNGWVIESLNEQVWGARVAAPDVDRVVLPDSGRADSVAGGQAEEARGALQFDIGRRRISFAFLSVGLLSSLAGIVILRDKHGKDRIPNMEGHTDGKE